ncbi:MAG: nucleotidyltransferase domain-containing protein [Ruminococcus sp.]|nr:nucleotidyltransferase domain-containing protein [Ruminococcus sp.]
MNNDINAIIAQPEYDFLRTEERLGKNIALLTFGGSKAYGLSTPQSDTDIRGIIMPLRSDLLGADFIIRECDKNNDKLIFGVNGFEQYLDRVTDTYLYVLSKIVGLFVKCNPNTIEMLGCLPEHYVCVSECGQKLLDNKSMFLSKLAYGSFAGYARAQFRRLKNAIGKDGGGGVTNVFRCISLADSLERIQRHLTETYPGYRRESIQMFITDRDGNVITVNGVPVDAYDVGVLFNDAVTEVTVNGNPIPDEEVRLSFKINFDMIEANDFSGVCNEVTSAIKEFNKHLGHRNHKKDVYHLNKHAMHLVRLYLMAEDILLRGEIITYREKEHDMLMSIKNGDYYNKEQNCLTTEFFDMVNGLDRRLLEAYQKSKLPDAPDMDKVNELLCELNESCL